MIFKKEMVGENIFALGTGNNARGKSDRIQTFKILKVARKYVTLVTPTVSGNDTQGEEYCMESGSTKGQINAGYGGNSGYEFYSSEAEINERIESKKISLKIFRSMNGSKDWETLSVEDLRQIEKMIEKIASNS